MNKNELIEALDSVITNLDNSINSTESAMIYLKLDIKKKAFEEVRNFIAEQLEESNTSQKATNNK